MLGAKCLILFVTLKFVLTDPVNRGDNVVLYADVTEDATKVSDVNINQLQNAQESAAENGESTGCSNSCEESSSIERISLLQSPELPLEYMQPSILTSIPQYQNYPEYPNVESMGIGIGNYRGVLFPYLHPKVLAAYNAGFTVNSLPPVLSTYIHGLVPQEERRLSYDMDVLGNQNAAYLPTVVRASRMIRDSDEELLAQLRHDAIMNNIVPTMPVPFARYAAAAAVPSYAPAPAPSGASAIFPGAAAGGCAQPILFSCSPKITRGTLRPVYSDAAAPAYRPDIGLIPAHPVNAPAALHPTVYRQEAGQTKSTLDKISSSVPHVGLHDQQTPKHDN